jgi:endonuclease YncB( thermonuclease family)
MIKQLLILFLSITSLSAQDTVLVKAVHDGDSYKIQWKTGEIEWVRLWGVDCPEVLFPPHLTKAQPYGVQAGNFVRSWLKGERIVIDTFPDQDDPFQRRIVKVQIDSALYSKLDQLDSIPGEWINDLSTYLVENGYAWWLDPILRTNQDRAKQTKIGLWGLPGRKVRPDTWRKRNWNN